MESDVQEKRQNCTVDNRHVAGLPKPVSAEATGSATKTEPVRRQWVYVLHPADYGISGCPTCGNTDCQWSEFEKMLWCARCRKDFKPASGGLFDGPIGIEVCRLLGIVFDRYEIVTGRVVKFEDDDWKDCWP